MRWTMWTLLAATVLAGCSGEYILTVPDQVAPAGGQATCVVRLQRNEFAGYRAAISGANMRFRVEQGEVRVAYTDNLGYAGATVPVGDRLGKLHMCVAHQDKNGDEVCTFVPMYVCDPDVSVVAVDLDALPQGRRQDAAQAALERIATNAYVIYLTRQDVSGHAQLHSRLKAHNYPDGPILLWQQENWHVVRDGKYNVPRVVVENRLVNPLFHLKQQFPALRYGLCTTDIAAKAFSQAGLKVVLVGDANVGSLNVIHRPSWIDLAAQGI